MFWQTVGGWEVGEGSRCGAPVQSGAESVVMVRSELLVLASENTLYKKTAKMPLLV